jgi:cell wall-associated NlpC family hydrolase
MPGGAARAVSPPPVSPPSNRAVEPSPETGGSATPVDAAATPPAPLAFARQLVDSALELRGVKYKNGGADAKGFDCSGFTQYVFAQYGLALPRAVRDQFLVGTSIDPSGDLAAGDLLFFTTTEPGASHVAIAIGNDEFVHAPSSTGVVRVEKLTVKYWADRFLGARRITQP